MSGVTTDENCPEQEIEGGDMAGPSIGDENGFIQTAGNDPPSDGETSSKRPRTEYNGLDRQREPPRYGEPYPGLAGQTYGRGQTTFEGWLNDGIGAWDPFQSEDEWDLVKWLVENANQTALDDFLKLEFVSVSLLRIEAEVMKNDRRNLGTLHFIISIRS